jgi:hypothetical protein
MKTEIYKGIGIVLLFSIFALALYPRPGQIISMLLVGIVSIFLFVVASKKIEKAQLQKGTRLQKLTYYGFQAILIIFVLAFQLVFRVSWFEKRLVFNILQTERGKAYIVIALAVGLLFMIYSGVFFIKNKRWPKSEDMGFKEKSRNLNPKEIKIVVSVGLLLLISLFGWMLYYIFSGK